jgi:hypothetical protein
MFLWSETGMCEIPGWDWCVRRGTGRGLAFAMGKSGMRRKAIIFILLFLDEKTHVVWFMKRQNRIG